MNILVTGGCGFIGSHVCRRLLREGHNVVVFDNFDPYYPRELKEGNLKAILDEGRVQLIEGDVRSEDDLGKLSEFEIDTIVHFASKAGVRPSLLNPEEYYEVNVIGTLRLLNYAIARGIKNIVFASSSSVYGKNPRRPWSESDHDLHPISPYASSKLACEHLGKVYAELHDIRFTALRFFTVYGPAQRPDLAIRKFAELITARKPIPVYGDGSTSRDYTFINDIVDGVYSATVLDHDKPFQIFNLGNGTPVSLLEMIEAIGAALELEPIMEFKPMQSGDAPHTLADISAAREVLGYNPTTKLSEGIKEYLVWARARGLEQSSASSVITDPAQS